jgi:hypothetical protein
MVGFGRDINNLPLNWPIQKLEGVLPEIFTECRFIAKKTLVLWCCRSKLLHSRCEFFGMEAKRASFALERNASAAADQIEAIRPASVGRLHSII